MRPSPLKSVQGYSDTCINVCVLWTWVITNISICSLHYWGQCNYILNTLLTSPPPLLKRPKVMGLSGQQKEEIWHFLYNIQLEISVISRPQLNSQVRDAWMLRVIIPSSDVTYCFWYLTVSNFWLVFGFSRTNINYTSFQVLCSTALP